MMNLELRIIDAPADLPARREEIDRAADRESERLPSEVDALGELRRPAFDLHIGGVGVPAGPLEGVDQIGPDNRRRRIDPAFVVDEDVDVAGFETLRPVNERRRLPQVVCGQAARFRGLRRRG
jgi:hypothetical protein